jgi:hypothetical protein
MPVTAHGVHWVSTLCCPVLQVTRHEDVDSQSESLLPCVARPAGVVPTLRALQASTPLGHVARRYRPRVARAVQVLARVRHCRHAPSFVCPAERVRRGECLSAYPRASVGAAAYGQSCCRTHLTCMSRCVRPVRLQDPPRVYVGPVARVRPSGISPQKDILEYPWISHYFLIYPII